MNLRWQISGWLLGCLALVYWGLALPFSLLYLNYDPDQLRCIMFDYFWGAPAFACLLILLPTWIELGKISAFMDIPSPEAAPAASALAERLPLSICRPSVLASVLGYLVAATQLRNGCQLPFVETYKFAILGLPTGLLFALLAYFILASHLRPVMETCETLARSSGPRVSLFWKTWACLLVVGLVPVTVMGLMSYTFSQRQLESNLAALNRNRLIVFASQVKTGRSWQLLELFQGHETVGISATSGSLSVVKGLDEGGQQMRLDLSNSGGPSGARVLRDDHTRVLVWQSLTDDRRLAVLIPLSDYTPQLVEALQGTLLASGVTLLVSLGLAWVLASHLSQPVITLTRLARGVTPEGARRLLPNWYADDELGELGRAIQDMLTELGEAHETLRTLFSVSRSISSNIELEAVFQELMLQVRQVTGADGCSIQLWERAGLVEKARLGQPGEENRLAVPMAVRGEPVGLLNVFHPDAAAHRELLERIAGQAAITIENAKVYEDRNYVTQLLCQALIPVEGLGFPGLQVAHRYIPSKILSGDYYDLIALSATRLGVVMADVAGKGPDAAIQTVRAKHVIRSLALAGYRPGQVLSHLNRLVNEDGDGRMVTVFYAEVDLEKGTIVYCNAGHEPPFCWRAATRDWSSLDSTGVVLGVVDPLESSEACHRFLPGDVLILCTDGVTEARSPDGQFLGIEPVLEVAARFLEGHPDALVEAVYRAVVDFSADTLTDDLSLLVLKVPAAPTANSPGA